MILTSLVLYFTPCVRVIKDDDVVVVRTGPPDRVGNCALVNLTVGTLEVGCTPGNNGGMPQHFVARVYAAPTHTLLATLREDKTPRYSVQKETVK